MRCGLHLPGNTAAPPLCRAQDAKVQVLVEPAPPDDELKEEEEEEAAEPSPAQLQLTLCAPPSVSHLKSTLAHLGQPASHFLRSSCRGRAGAAGLGRGAAGSCGGSAGSCRAPTALCKRALLS